MPIGVLSIYESGDPEVPPSTKMGLVDAAPSKMPIRLISIFVM